MTFEVRHNPFSRDALIRKTHVNYFGNDDCSWCGQRPHILYSYTYSSNRLPVRRIRYFCNLECFDCYNS